MRQESLHGCVIFVQVIGFLLRNLEQTASEYHEEIIAEEKIADLVI